jgi:dynein light intermediate chain 1, cytosolic
MVSTMVGSDQDESARPNSSEGKKEIWSSMLDGVSSGKRLPEKSLLVLGMWTHRASRDPG